MITQVENKYGLQLQRNNPQHQSALHQITIAAEEAKIDLSVQQTAVINPVNKIEIDNTQIEIDLTIEYRGIVGIFEAKNGKPDSFAVYQIYHPFLYYHKAKKDIDINKNLKKIICVYLVRTVKEEINYINLWAYTFLNPLDISTIKLLKSVTYKLIRQN